MDGLVDHRRPDPPTLEEQLAVIRAGTRLQVLILRLSLGRHAASSETCGGASGWPREISGIGAGGRHDSLFGESPPVSGSVAIRIAMRVLRNELIGPQIRGPRRRLGSAKARGKT